MIPDIRRLAWWFYHNKELPSQLSRAKERKKVVQYIYDPNDPVEASNSLPVHPGIGASKEALQSYYEAGLKTVRTSARDVVPRMKE